MNGYVSGMACILCTTNCYTICLVNSSHLSTPIVGVFAPGRCSNRTKCGQGDSAVEGYLVAHNALLAHAAAVSLYRSEYASGGGVIGITLNIDWAYPLDPSSTADQAAAKRRNEFTFSWFADPIFFGIYPLSMRNGAGDRCAKTLGYVEWEELKQSYSLEIVLCIAKPLCVLFILDFLILPMRRWRC